MTASLLQPAIGMYTDKRPLPYSLPVGMASTLVGLIVLGFAGQYWLLLLGSALVGLGSAIFHPESSRVARLASGGRHGFAQSLFQVGGNVGPAIGPLLAAFIVLPRGQSSVAWFSRRFAAGHDHPLAGRQLVRRIPQGQCRPRVAAPSSRCRGGPPHRAHRADALTFTKNVYMAGISSYYTFFLIDNSACGADAQLLLFVFLGAFGAGHVPRRTDRRPVRRQVS